MISLLILLQSDSFWSNLPLTIAALGVLVGTAITALISLLSFIRSGRAVQEAADAKKESIAAHQTGKENKVRLEDIGKSVDGNLKELMHVMRETYFAQGIASEKVKHEKQQSDIQSGIDLGKEQERKEQGFRDQPSTKKNNIETKEEIIRVVETKADETKKVVEKIPDEVVKKITPHE